MGYQVKEKPFKNQLSKNLIMEKRAPILKKTKTQQLDNNKNFN